MSVKAVVIASMRRQLLREKTIPLYPVKTRESIAHFLIFISLCRIFSAQIPLDLRFCSLPNDCHSDVVLFAPLGFGGFTISEIVRLS